MTTKVGCPNCSHEFNVDALATIPRDQRIVLELTKADGHVMFGAKTIGEVIVAQDKLLRMVAKDLGEKVSVFITAMSISDVKASIEFFIARNKTSEAKR